MRFHSIQFGRAIARAHSISIYVKFLISFELNGNQANFAFMCRFSSLLVSARNAYTSSIIFFFFAFDPSAQTQ